MGPATQPGSFLDLGAVLSDVRFAQTHRHRWARASGPKRANGGHLRAPISDIQRRGSGEIEQLEAT